MLELLKYTIPALIVLITAYLILHKMLREERDKRTHQLRLQDRQITIPIQLRAYERLALMLERIQPEHLIRNADIQNLTPQQLQQHLLHTIRLETDHNLSQQIYVSADLWQHILVAREEMANFINSIMQQMPSDATTLQFAQALITAYANNGQTPTDVALLQLRQETLQLLR